MAADSFGYLVFPAGGGGTVGGGATEEEARANLARDVAFYAGIGKTIAEQALWECCPDCAGGQIRLKRRSPKTYSWYRTCPTCKGTGKKADLVVDRRP